MSQARARSVTTVVLDAQGHRVLMHLRGDIRLWSLPGGGVEADEDWEDAAERETREETGFAIAIDRLVGEYARPDIGDRKRLFVGRVVGGQATAHPPESIRIAWFDTSRLPVNRMPWTRDYVRDAIASSSTTITRTQFQPRLLNVAIRSLYALSDFRVCLAERLRSILAGRSG